MVYPNQICFQFSLHSEMIKLGPIGMLEICKVFKTGLTMKLISGWEWVYQQAGAGSGDGEHGGVPHSY